MVTTLTLFVPSAASKRAVRRTRPTINSIRAALALWGLQPQAFSVLCGRLALLRSHGEGRQGKKFRDVTNSNAGE